MVTKEKERKKRERQKLTPEQARSFPAGERLTSAVAILNAQAQRASQGIHPYCKCTPYEDWFTYHRWQAQGLQVKQGEHGSIRIPIIIESEDPDTGETRRRPWTSVLFCRCQVQEGANRNE